MSKMDFYSSHRFSWEKHVKMMGHIRRGGWGMETKLVTKRVGGFPQKDLTVP